MTGRRNPKRNSEIIALRKDGASPRQIARDLGLSAGIVSGVLNRAKMTDTKGVHSLQRRGLGKITPEWARYIRANYSPRHKLFGRNAMARMIGCSAFTIHAVLRGTIGAEQ